jgi:hypothetical protein
MVLPLEVLPLIHILTVLLAGAVGFYLLPGLPRTIQGRNCLASVVGGRRRFCAAKARLPVARSARRCVG